MRRLKVDLNELEVAFENASWEMSHCLDLETGQVVMITDDIRRELEAIYEEMNNEEREQLISFADLLERRDLRDWQRETLREADQVEAGYGTRYIGVPRADSGEGYRDMEAFIATVRDECLQERLWSAIRGRGAFRRFKDVLLDYPRERERWFQFKYDQVQQRILDWLQSKGIEPIIEPPPEE